MKTKKIIIFFLLGVLLVIGMVVGVTAFSNNNLVLEAEMGIGGFGTYNRYLPLTIKMQNEGNRVSGKIHIVVENSSIDYWKTFSITSSETQEIKVPLWYTKGMGENIQIDVLNQVHTVIAKKTINVHDRKWTGENEFLVGVLCEQQSPLQYFLGIQLKSYSGDYRTVVTELHPSDLDENVKNLEMLDFIVINQYDTTTLSSEQITAIEKWVEQGGQLIIGTGREGACCLQGFDEKFMPYLVGEVKKKNLEVLGHQLELELATIQDKQTGKENTKREDKQLYKAFMYGAGKVMIARCDLSVESMENVQALEEMWREIWEEILLNEKIKIKGNGYHTINMKAVRDLENIRRKDLPNIIVVVAPFGICCILLGIGRYLLHNKKSKKEYIGWGTALLVILVIVLYFQFNSSIAYIVNEVDLIDVQLDGNAAQTSYCGVINISNPYCKMTETDDVSFKYIENYQYGAAQGNQHIYYYDNKLVYEDKQCDIYRHLATDPKKVEAPLYVTKLYDENEDYRFTFENKSEQKIERLLIQWESKVWDCGEVDIGRKIDIDLNKEGYTQFWDIKNMYSGTKKLQDLWPVIACYRGTHSEKQEPIYLAITKTNDNLLDLGKKYNTASHYAMYVGEIASTYIDEGKTIIPYEHFKPIVKSTQGSGSIAESSFPMVIFDTLTVKLGYTIPDTLDVDKIIIEANKNDSYANSTYLKGDVYIYNFMTDDYELIDAKEDKWIIEKEQLPKYYKNQIISLKVVGKNEDCAIVPYVSVVANSNKGK